MIEYNVDNLLRIAKRYNNNKRSYLLVNPLQGKHLPTKPKAALDMMKALGDKVAEKYSDAKFVIGFAETATAIGVMVAASLSEKCIYIHTTREPVSPCIEFLEEHSHAPEQRLYSAKLSAWIDSTSTVVFVDDEISTGKTLCNMIRQLKSLYPTLNQKRLVAASIINRLTPENEAIFQREGIDCVYLVKLSEADFDVSNINIEAPHILAPAPKFPGNMIFIEEKMPPNPRLGVSIGKYIHALRGLSMSIYRLVESDKYDSVLIAGTEEFMFPAIFAAAEVEEDDDYEVVTQSTTRSPIGISNAKDYPINEGFQLRSVYDENRTTYIYNLDYYDLIIFLTDIAEWNETTSKDLISICHFHGFRQLILVGDVD